MKVMLPDIASSQLCLHGRIVFQCGRERESSAKDGTARGLGAGCNGGVKELVGELAAAYRIQRIQSRAE